ncbi:DEAD/DEAH box helicase [Thiospirillum jenense]|uniref:ATP-dependent RNA helicase DeaD n=1 Tax=Thiospirillum jenense TaxID=1653858 RepID=A0A839HF49_9GAMM|nr:DEAD/DEAH box helicase [Thiospirillum jenense]MBB1126730.1 DEAD/DEAH box helicase [Thiospirillum jenense]
MSLDTPEIAASVAATAPADTDAVPNFAALGLSPPLAQAVTRMGYETPTPIQQQCIPHLLAGRDLLGQAQTGTGKTAAFALPLLNNLQPNHDLPQILVLTPTRELALQVAEAFQVYAQNLPNFHVLPIYGGQSYSLQIRQLRRTPQVIVGTPGRIMDHMRRQTLSLDGLRTLVLDEADEMLNMGFAEDIDWIFDHCPAERQVALFSATMPDGIKKVARARLRDPVEVRVRAASETVDTIEQRYCLVTRAHKLDVLTRLLELEPFDGLLIFVRTKNATAELADKLKAHGFAAEPLNGDMNQDLRERTIARLRDGQLDILIATDVAARGLDVERISHVINFDIPTDPPSYVHRIGRTGRAGRPGRAILLVEPRERGLLRAIERVIRRDIPPMEPPSAAALSATRIERFTADLRTTLAEQDLDFFYRLIARLTKEQELDLMDVAAALSFLLQRERPLEVREERPPPRQFERRDDRPRDERPRRRSDRDGDYQQRPPRERDRGSYDPRERAPSAGDDSRRRDRERPPPFEGDQNLTSYRIEVGHRDGVTPREIVGAIANEAGLSGRMIGRIDIRDDHTLVDLPATLARDTLQHLKRVYVCGQALQISLATGGGGQADAPPRRERVERGDSDRYPRRAPPSSEPRPPRGDHPRHRERKDQR